MGGYAKWIGGVLGWVLGKGPIGALIGFALGSMLDNTKVYVGSPKQTTSGDFLMSLLVLIAAVLKADGKVMQSELDYVKLYLRRNFGEETTLEALKVLKEMLNKEIPLKEVCDQIRENMNYSSRLQILHFLIGIARADGTLSASELNMIDRIAVYLGISSADFQSIRSMFIEETDWAYKVLEIEKSASDNEVKKAYRRMAMKYHPDKVSTLGEDIKKAATEKFKKLNEAYEKIKKERGLV